MPNEAANGRDNSQQRQSLSFCGNWSRLRIETPRTNPLNGPGCAAIAIRLKAQVRPSDFQVAYLYGCRFNTPTPVMRPRILSPKTQRRRSHSDLANNNVLYIQYVEEEE